MTTHSGAPSPNDPFQAVTPKVCIFCGATNDLTREHVLPQWTRASGRSLDGEDRLWRTFREYSGEPMRIPSRQEVRQGDPFTFRPRVACAKCNNGWLSRFDNDEVKPIAQPLIEGRVHRLAPTPSMIIARWAAMRTAVAEFVDNAARVSTPAMTHPMRTGTLPEQYQVWIGRSDTLRGTWITQQSLVAVPRGQKTPTSEDILNATGQFTCIRIGALVLLTFARRSWIVPVPTDVAPGVFLPLPTRRRADLRPLVAISTEPHAQAVLDGCLGVTRTAWAVARRPPRS